MAQCLRTFEITYIGASNYKVSRVKITDLKRGESKYISYDYNSNNIIEIAIKYLKCDRNIDILFTSASKKGYLLHTDNFSISIKTY